MGYVHIKDYPTIPRTWTGSLMEWTYYCNDIVKSGFADGSLHVPDHPLQVVVAQITDHVYIDHTIEVHHDRTVYFRPKVNQPSPPEEYSDISSDKLEDVNSTTRNLSIVTAIIIITLMIRTISYYTWWPIFMNWLKDVLSCLI